MEEYDPNAKWEFDAPRFWDFSETVAQNRPNETWFSDKTSSAPSFGRAAKKRRPLRINNYNPNPNPSNSQPSSRQPQRPLNLGEMHAKAKTPASGSVFDRLSRTSTISFSHKANSHLPEEIDSKRHHQPQHMEVDTESQHQLKTDPVKDSVAERVARLEKSVDHKVKPLFAKKEFKLKQSITHSNLNSKRELVAPPSETSSVTSSSLYDDFYHIQDEQDSIHTKEPLTPSYTTSSHSHRQHIPIQSYQPILQSQPAEITHELSEPIAMSIMEFKTEKPTPGDIMVDHIPDSTVSSTDEQKQLGLDKGKLRERDYIPPHITKKFFDSFIECRSDFDYTLPLSSNNNYDVSMQSKRKGAVDFSKLRRRLAEIKREIEEINSRSVSGKRPRLLVETEDEETGELEQRIKRQRLMIKQSKQRLVDWLERGPVSPSNRLSMVSSATFDYNIAGRGR